MKRSGWISLLLCGLALGATLVPAARAQGVSSVSPFVPQPGAGMSSPAENSPIELCGIISSPGGYIFGLFDPVKRVGTWVKLNETGQEVLVRSFDPAADAVTVEYQGRVITLALKTSKIEAVVPVQPAVASQGAHQQVAAPAGAPTDQQRLEMVAAEVRRRRALRQAAAQQQAAQPPGQGQGR